MLSLISRFVFCSIKLLKSLGQSENKRTHIAPRERDTNYTHEKLEIFIKSNPDKLNQADYLKILWSPLFESPVQV
jgi:hypothetical protein